MLYSFWELHIVRNFIHYVIIYLLAAVHEKVPAKNAIYAHAQDVAASDELLLAILKTFIPQSLNKQQTIGFRVF
jgi:hypothetical protein